MTTELTIGPVHNVIAQVIYALPSCLVTIFHLGGGEVSLSNDLENTFPPLILLPGLAVEFTTAAPFITFAQDGTARLVAN